MEEAMLDINTKNDNFKDNYNDNYISIHTNRQ